MTTETPAADRQVAADLAAAREAVENLVNLFFDRVSIGELTADPESGREQLAECIHEGLSDEWTRLYRIAAVPARRILGATEQADTETAPAVDRAATLHEAADVLDQRAAGLEALSSSSFGEESFAARELTEQAGRLRRLAAEAQQPTPAPAEAHPAEHTWAAELHDPLANEWIPGTRYLVRDRAVNDLDHARKIAATWKDGTPTERRLVRATTTYTVEPTP